MFAISSFPISNDKIPRILASILISFVQFLSSTAALCCNRSEKSLVSPFRLFSSRLEKAIDYGEWRECCLVGLGERENMTNWESQTQLVELFSASLPRTSSPHRASLTIHGEGFHRSMRLSCECLKIHCIVSISIFHCGLILLGNGHSRPNGSVRRIHLWSTREKDEWRDGFFILAAEICPKIDEKVFILPCEEAWWVALSAKSILS